MLVAYRFFCPVLWCHILTVPDSELKMQEKLFLGLVIHLLDYNFVSSLHLLHSFCQAQFYSFAPRSLLREFPWPTLDARHQVKDFCFVEDCFVPQSLLAQWHDSASLTGCSHFAHFFFFPFFLVSPTPKTRLGSEEKFSTCSCAGHFSALVSAAGRAEAPLTSVVFSPFRFLLSFFCRWHILIYGILTIVLFCGIHRCFFFRRRNLCWSWCRTLWVEASCVWIVNNWVEYSQDVTKMVWQ